MRIKKTLIVILVLITSSLSKLNILLGMKLAPFMETIIRQRTNPMNQKYPVKLSETERSQLK
ncbi:MAG: hypothetical protein NTZ74_05715, partial [Chloroflexi bacterium]|nr:hypothetical protein [Chloroflexota bacterium]